VASSRSAPLELERERKPSLGKSRTNNNLRLTLFLTELEDEISTVHQIAKIGSLKDLQSFLLKASDTASLIDLNNNVNFQTPLHVCIENNHTEMALYLINECNASLEVRDKIGRTAFLYAVRYGNFALCKVLVEKGADVNVMDGFNENALHLAVVNGYQEILTWLLEETTVDVNSQNTYDLK
jgi:ankyrin repeat protein